MEKKNASYVLNSIIVAILSASVLLLPIFFLTFTTEAFTIPKELLIVYMALILIFLWGVKTFLEGKVILTTAPFNLPILLFVTIILISAFLSRNRFDALLASIPVIGSALLYFVIINTVKSKKSFSLILFSLILGGIVSSLIFVLYYFKLYFLPIPQIQKQSFNTFGSLIQAIIYILPLFVFCLLSVIRKIRPVSAFPLIAGVCFLIALFFALHQIIFFPQKPIVLPFIYGLQTAAAAVTQDTQRFLLSLLFGSGYGTFLSDFTRFKLPAFNLERNIWNLNFAFSSSFLLELIATTGLLGSLSYLFIAFSVIKTRITKSPLFAALVLTFLLSFILPFSYSSITLLFVLLGIYASYLNMEGDRRVYEVILSTITATKGITGRSALAPIIFLLIITVVGFIGFWTTRFALSDIAFAKSLEAANQNNGQLTYQLQTQAIQDFPYRADYHRIFSQVNLALAGSISQGLQGSSPSAQVQQGVTSLLQQSITSARNAVIISPQTSMNWQNLAQVYRSLINIGQNAEQFTIASLNQAIALGPYNPQLYIQLGGVYYQMRQFQAAEDQFQIAVNLKRDFANAYYNLGHAQEAKGELEKAFTNYQIARELSRDNKESLVKIEAEIKALESRLDEGRSEAKASLETKIEPKTEQPPLSISSPQANLQPQKPQIKISPPPQGERQ